MEKVTIQYEGRAIEFEFFFDTVHIGKQDDKYICNIFTFLTKDEAVKEIVGEGFHIVFDITGQIQPPAVYAIPTDPDLEKREKQVAIKNALIDVTFGG